MRPTNRSPEVEPTNGVGLLRRYRTLCEAQGLGRANRLPLAESAASELVDVERQLVELLEASGSNSGEGPGETTDADDAASPTPDPSTVGAGRKLVATVFTDGSAEGNPGPGGYCAIVRIPGRPDRELSGGTNHTTNNKMELTAAVVGLRCAIDAGAHAVTVMTDSEYLVKGMSRWLSGWKSKNWLTAERQPVKNRELWEQLDHLTQGRSIQWQWIRGHAGHPENERCDLIATRAAREAARSS